MKNPKEIRIMTMWRTWGMAAMLAVCAPAALAQTVIQSITSTQQAGADVVSSS